MKIIVFDTETTGLPTERNANIFDTECWPHIVQLSYILYDTESHIILNLEDDIIKIDETTIITPESIAIHKITRTLCDTKGISIKESLYKFNACLLEADLVVGHNVSFDKRMIMVECIRNKIKQSFNVGLNRKSEYCTMKNGSDKCKIVVKNKTTGEDYFKWPTLTELHEYLFNGQKPAGTHNALSDILICLRCYMKMTIDYDVTLGSRIKQLYTLHCK
jgi:DNA polymerase-3 subunit epsilon